MLEVLKQLNEQKKVTLIEKVAVDDLLTLLVHPHRHLITNLNSKINAFNGDLPAQTKLENYLKTNPEDWLFLAECLGIATTRSVQFTNGKWNVEEGVEVLINPKTEALLNNKELMKDQELILNEVNLAPGKLTVYLENGAEEGKSDRVTTTSEFISKLFPEIDNKALRYVYASGLSLTANTVAVGSLAVINSRVLSYLGENAVLSPEVYQNIMLVIVALTTGNTIMNVIPNLANKMTPKEV